MLLSVILMGAAVLGAGLIVKMMHNSGSAVAPVHGGAYMPNIVLKCIFKPN